MLPPYRSEAGKGAGLKPIKAPTAMNSGTGFGTMPPPKLVPARQSVAAPTARKQDVTPLGGRAVLPQYGREMAGRYLRMLDDRSRVTLPCDLALIIEELRGPGLLAFCEVLQSRLRGRR